MLPNTSPDVQDIIDNADYPIIVVVVGNPCTEFKGQFQSTLEEEIQKHPEMVVFHVVCVSEDEVPFPRPFRRAISWCWALRTTTAVRPRWEACSFVIRRAG